MAILGTFSGPHGGLRTRRAKMLTAGGRVLRVKLGFMILLASGGFILKPKSSIFCILMFGGLQTDPTTGTECGHRGGFGLYELICLARSV